MAEVRNYYAGGNTGSGFYSYYNYIFPYKSGKKVIFKGGPGTGKSSLIKTLGKSLEEKFPTVDYYWCSSDNHSLDALAVEKIVCFVDGTAPHLIDPRYPGVCDEIINLGQFWDEAVLAPYKNEIIELTDLNSDCFKKAYKYLSQAAVFFREWEYYYREAMDNAAVNRNTLSLTEDFLSNAVPSQTPLRHLFAAAITPGGIDCKIDSVVKKDYEIFAIQGSPGTGVKNILSYIHQQCLLRGIYAEILHCPLNPQDIDVIVLPHSKSAILDLSNHIVNYEKCLQIKKFRRRLDMEQFVKPENIDPYAKHIAVARDRFYASIQEAINYIKNAKIYHDKLESFYIPAMDFEAINQLGQKLISKYTS